jgi:hypothetical protein
MVENRSNIGWYLPQAYVAKLLPVFTQIDDWFYKQAQSEAHNGEAAKNDPRKPVSLPADVSDRVDD